MQIEITAFVRDEAPMDYSASRAEIGDTARQDTWRAAMERAAVPPPMLDTPEKIEALRDYMRGFGAWSDEEIAAWTDQECEALFIQEISNRMREGNIHSDMSEEDWQEYEAGCEEGRFSGCLYRGDDGRIWFYLGT